MFSVRGVSDSLRVSFLASILMISRLLSTRIFETNPLLRNMKLSYRNFYSSEDRVFQQFRAELDFSFVQFESTPI